MKKIFLLLLSLNQLFLFSQDSYIREQATLMNMLNGNAPPNLREAVYAVENAYFEGTLNKEDFYNQINLYALLCQGIILSGDIYYAGQGDEQAAKTQCAAFVLMTDSIPLQLNEQLSFKNYPTNITSISIFLWMHIRSNPIIY